MPENSVLLGSPAFLRGLQVAPSTRLGAAGQLPFLRLHRRLVAESDTAPFGKRRGQGAVGTASESLPSVPWAIVETYAQRLRIMVF